MVHSQKLDMEYDYLKEQEPDCSLLMPVGAFMRVMDDDAWAVAEVTGLKLTAKESGPL